MNNELKIFENPEFGKLRTVEIDGIVWFVGKDVADALGYSDAFGALKKHVDEEDKLVCQIDSAGQKRDATVINESGLYSLVLSSKLPSARKFKRWVTADVLPAIRKTGGYAIPQDYPSALRALADAEEKRLALAAENEQQRQAIADFEPIRRYVDTILESTSAMATSQIAADYDLTAQRLNKILKEVGIQHNVNGQWILYKKHMGQGYTKSKTIQFTRSDGRPDSKVCTQWSQKGRLLIHNILTSRGIVAVMDKENAN